MNILKYALIFLLLGSTAAIAEPAKESSVKQLLAVTQVKKLVERVQGQVSAMMDNTIQQALKGKTPTAKQRQAITNMKNKMVALMREELAWKKLEPVYLRLYRETFTEKEIQGMLTFYKTPAGQALIHKMPELIQKTMLMMRMTIKDMVPKMQKIQQDFAAEMKAANK